jgi:SPP1 gp7 family putative phage head morphogenesis protein
MASPLTDAFWEEEAAILRAAIGGIVEDTALAGLAAGMNALGPGVAIDWTLLNQAARDYARQYSYALVSMLNETSRAALQQELADWIESGRPLDALIESLSPMFGPVRAEMIAATEVTRVYMDSNTIAWKESGAVTGWRFNTSADDIVCEICGPNAGQEFALDDGENYPPLHPRCRCWGQPVVRVSE